MAHGKQTTSWKLDLPAKVTIDWTGLPISRTTWPCEGVRRLDIFRFQTLIGLNCFRERENSLMQFILLTVRVLFTLVHTAVPQKDHLRNISLNNWKWRVLCAVCCRLCFVIELPRFIEIATWEYFGGKIYTNVKGLWKTRNINFRFLKQAGIYGCNSTLTGFLWRMSFLDN